MSRCFCSVVVGTRFETLLAAGPTKRRWLSTRTLLTVCCVDITPASLLTVSELPYNDYFEYYGPDFKLHITPSNMTNHNTPEYMDKVKYEGFNVSILVNDYFRVRIFESLRSVSHAPGVQMQGRCAHLALLCSIMGFLEAAPDALDLEEREKISADEADPDKRLPGIPLV